MPFDDCRPLVGCRLSASNASLAQRRARPVGLTCSSIRQSCGSLGLICATWFEPLPKRFPRGRIDAADGVAWDSTEDWREVEGSTTSSHDLRFLIPSPYPLPEGEGKKEKALPGVQGKLSGRQGNMIRRSRRERKDEKMKR
jgi:hypothetical protein